MYDTVMVPLDGSDFAEAGLPLALELTRRTHARLHLVTVVEPISEFVQAGWEDAALAWSEAYLTRVAEGCTATTGGEVTTSTLSGHVTEALLTEADEQRVDVTVMATHGRGALSRAWLGSVADSFVRQADAPVILVRPGENPVTDGVPGGLETILVPLDGSELSEHALHHAVELGELFDAAYHLTRVVAHPLDVASPYLHYTVVLNEELVGHSREHAAAYLEEHAERMRKRGLRVTTSVAVDTQPGRAILSESEAVEPDLIAMATHGRTGLTRVVLGSAADKVLRGARVPTLLYRPAKVPVYRRRRSSGMSTRPATLA